MLKFNEPFLKLRNQGLILGPDGEKMSKSRGNVINPDDMVREFGADSLRMYEMFMGPLEDQKPWQTNGVIGIRRFLDRVWGWVNNIQYPISNIQTSDKANRLLHKLIKKVTEDITGFHFNTAISSFMEFHNEIKTEAVSKEFIKTFLILLYPFAPHIAEELYQSIGGKKSLQLESWPKFEPHLVIDQTVEIVVQVNGKVKGKLTVDRGIGEEVLKKQALELPAVKQSLVDESVKRVIYVPNKLINLVI
jgi:leucyl-tRNA synthetase